MPVSYTHLDVYKRQIREQMADYARRRTEKQPLDMPSAGSTFKRPEGAYASALIDQCGLRGYAVGAVSYTHLDVYKRQVHRRSSIRQCRRR